MPWAGSPISNGPLTFFPSFERQWHYLCGWSAPMPPAVADEVVALPTSGITFRPSPGHWRGMCGPWMITESTRRSTWGRARFTCQRTAPSHATVFSPSTFHSRPSAIGFRVARHRPRPRQLRSCGRSRAGAPCPSWVRYSAAWFHGVSIARSSRVPYTEGPRKRRRFPRRDLAPGPAAAAGPGWFLFPAAGKRGSSTVLAVMFIHR